MADTEAERRAKRAWEARERAKDPDGFKRRQLEAQKRYYEKNAEKIRAKKRARHETNKEAENARGRADYIKNREKRTEASAKWKDLNREKYLEGSRRQNLKKYALTPELWEVMFTSQGNRCACCEAETPGHKNGWHVDHCHKSGATRSIICHACNVALGCVDDSAEHLRKLIAYLEKHSVKD